MTFAITGWWDVSQVGYLSITNTPFDKYDYMICHSLQHTADGSTDESKVGRDVEAVADDFVAACVAADCIPLLGFFQSPEGTSQYTLDNTTPATIDNLVGNYVAYAQSKGFAGIVTDWEGNIDNDQWIDLHAKFRAAWPGMFLSAYFAFSQRVTVGLAREYLDEYMLNTYDSHTTDFNSVSLTTAWHNAATRGTAPFTGVKSGSGIFFYSQNIVDQDPLDVNKLSLAVPFYGRILEDPSVPQDPGDAITDVANWDVPTYTFQEVQDLSTWANRTVDTTAKAPYIPDASDVGYVSYSDAQHMLEFAALADENGLRGLASFAVHQEYLSAEAGDAKYPMSTQLRTSADYAPDDLLQDFIGGHPGNSYTKDAASGLLINGENPVSVDDDATSLWNDWNSDLTTRSGILYDFGNPDGSTVLNHIGADGTANWKYINHAWTGTANKQVMVSAYFHAAEETWVSIAMGDTNMAVWRNQTWFDLTGSGALGASPVNVGGNAVVSTAIEAVGALDATGFRWFRCSMLIDPPTDLTAFSVRLALAGADSGLGYTATSVGDGAYIWGAHANQGSTINWPQKVSRTVLGSQSSAVISPARETRAVNRAGWVTLDQLQKVHAKVQSDLARASRRNTGRKR